MTILKKKEEKLRRTKCQITERRSKRNIEKRATKSVTVQFYKNTEQPLIEHLEQQPNKSGYIKGLIKEDIEKNN